MNNTISKTELTQEQISNTKLLLTSPYDKKIMSNMTNEEWQEHLSVLRLLSHPTEEIRLIRNPAQSRVIGRYWTLSNGCYDGVDSLDKRYVSFINSVLKNIRRPTKKPVYDHVYHFYHIAELLRFEPQLQCELIHNDGVSYLEVWLDRESC